MSELAKQSVTIWHDDLLRHLTADSRQAVSKPAHHPRQRKTSTKLQEVRLPPCLISIAPSQQLTSHLKHGCHQSWWKTSNLRDLLLEISRQSTGTDFQPLFIIIWMLCMMVGSFKIFWKRISRPRILPKNWKNAWFFRWLLMNQFEWCIDLDLNHL